MTKLSVNVNKIATLRNSRGGNNPDVVKVALDAISFGAEGITVHPRPDERHIRRSDVYELAKVVKSVEFNIEGYPSEDFLQLIEEVKPDQCTLVPDPPDVLTSNAGWKIRENKELLIDVVGRLKSVGCRVSLFFDPYDFKSDELAVAKSEVGADRIELYTEMFAKAYHTPEKEAVMAVYKKCAAAAVEAGLGINAGHDLDLNNLNFLVREIPEVAEVSIGHALIADALYMGLETTIGKYLECLR